MKPWICLLLTLTLAAGPLAALDIDAAAKAQVQRALLAAHAAAQNAPVIPIAPEDGSLPATKFFYAQDLNDDQLKTALEGTGITPQRIDMRGFPQDQIFFDSNGAYLAQAIPPVVMGDVHATKEVFFDEDGPNQRRINHISAERAKAELTPRARALKYFFAEGGAVITGRFVAEDPDTTYLLIGYSAKENITKIDLWTRQHYGQKQQHPTNARGEYPEAVIKQMISQDLGVKEENIVFVDRVGQHLDLYAFPLPGGKILVNDFNMSLALLKKHKLAPQDAKLEYYVDHTEKQIVAALEQFNAASTGHKFEIVRVAGNFFTTTRLCHRGEVCHKANFMNAVNLRTSKGHMVFANAAVTRDLRVTPARHTPIFILQEHWIEVLAAHGVKRDNIRFMAGHIEYTHGIDCASVARP